MYSVCVYIDKKVVSYYDLSVLSMSVISFPKKSLAYAEYFFLSKGLPHDSANGCCLFIQLFLDCRATLYCGSRPTQLSCRHTSSSRFFLRPACPLVS